VARRSRQSAGVERRRQDRQQGRVSCIAELWTEMRPLNAFLATAAVERTAGVTLADFARVHLFEPLRIHHFAWRRGSHQAILHQIVATLEFSERGSCTR
jgi:hypothetical protein